MTPLRWRCHRCGALFTAPADELRIERAAHLRVHDSADRGCDRAKAAIRRRVAKQRRRDREEFRARQLHLWRVP